MHTQPPKKATPKKEKRVVRQKKQKPKEAFSDCVR
jgi:hypothetical protein